MATNDPVSCRCRRSARDSSASTVPRPARISAPMISRCIPSSRLRLDDLRVTRPKAASRLSPASTQTTSRSSKSGNSLPVALRERALSPHEIEIGSRRCRSGARPSRHEDGSAPGAPRRQEFGEAIKAIARIIMMTQPLARTHSSSPPARRKYPASSSLRRNLSRSRLLMPKRLSLKCRATKASRPCSGCSIGKSPSPGAPANGAAFGPAVDR